ncbi:MAG: polysaccharide deacetylase family protein [bacterium]|nr:polysaccharide deacetylase family protein [bacterium]
MQTSNIAKPFKQALVSILSLFPARFSALSILMYHSVSDSDAFFAVSPKKFGQQMKYIHDSGFGSVFASEIPARMESRKLARTVCITFDDGYEDVYTNAYPILKSLNIKATVFLITNEIGGSYTNSEGRTFPLLGREQIAEMRVSGLVEFMPHGHTHRKLHQLTESEQKKEIALSRNTIKDLTGSFPEVFAYPRGHTNPAIAEMLKRFGFTLALGVVPGLVRRDSERYNLPRNAVDKNVEFQEFKLKLSDRVEWYSAISRFFR